MYTILSRSGDERFFDTYKELLIFLKDSYVLENACHNFNDKRVDFDHMFDIVKGHYVREIRYTFREYMFIDPYGRILNIPELILDCESVEEVKHKYRPYWNLTLREWFGKVWAFRESRNPIPYRNYYRRIKTKHERTWNSAIDHKPYVRPKRRPHCLDPWDIEKMSCNKGYGWKQWKRLRKQWMYNV
jgi:hypothetical protein